MKLSVAGTGWFALGSTGERYPEVEVAAGIRHYLGHDFLKKKSANLGNYFSIVVFQVGKPGSG